MTTDADVSPAQPRRPRGRPADPIARLRVWAWTWLSRARSPFVEPPQEVLVKAARRAASGDAEGREPRATRRKSGPRDPVARLRQWAWTWLGGPEARDARVAAEIAADKLAKKEQAEAASPRRRREELARRIAFRRAAWDVLHSPELLEDPSRPAEVSDVARAHLKCVLEALVFASDSPLTARELARLAKADGRLVRALLAELVAEYRPRGFRLDEIAGGFVFRTSAAFAPFVREQVAKKPVRMTRAQIETLAIVAYRQPVTRPEVDDVRGVDSGAVMKSLLERDLVRILGKKDEPGRPMIYGTTSEFLSFFGLRSLSDLPTLREFTELSDDSKRTYERELGEEPPDTDAPAPADLSGLMGGEGTFRRGTLEASAIPVADFEDPDELPTQGGDIRREDVDSRREDINSRREDDDSRREDINSRREDDDSRREDINSRREDDDSRREDDDSRREDDDSAEEDDEDEDDEDDEDDDDEEDDDDDDDDDDDEDDDDDDDE